MRLARANKQAGGRQRINDAPALPRPPSLTPRQNPNFRGTIAQRPRRTHHPDRARFIVWCTEQHKCSRRRANGCEVPRTSCKHGQADHDRAQAGDHLRRIATSVRNPADHGMVRRTLTGIRRKLGTAQRQKRALLATTCARLLRRSATPCSTSAIAFCYYWPARRRLRGWL